MDRYRDLSDSQPQAMVRHLPNSAIARNGTVTVPYSIEAQDDNQSDGGLLEYWRMFCRHKGAIFLSAICGLGLGYLVGIPMQPMYRTHTSVEVLNLNQDFMNLKQSSEVTSGYTSDDSSEVQTQAKLIQSESVLKRVSAKLSGNHSATGGAVQGAATGWRRWLQLPGSRTEPARSILTAQAAGSLVVRPVAKTRLLDIIVSSSSPRFAADFANTLTQEFIQQNLDAHFQATKSTGDWLSHELSEARAELVRSENALQAYVRESGLIFTSQDTSTAGGKLQQFQDQLSTATGDRISKQSRLALAQNSPPDSLADVLSDPSLQNIVSRLNQGRAQLADFNTVYTPEYTKIKRLQAEVENLQVAFERTRGSVLRRIQNDYDEAVQKEKLLSSAYEAQVREVTGQGEKAIQYNILKRDSDSNRLLYDTMLQQLKQSSIASALRASNLRVVDPATVPTSPFFPNFRANSGVGMLLGLFISMALVIVHERADRTLQQPGDMGLWVNIPELGVVPNAGNTPKMGYYSGLSERKSNSAVSGPSSRALPDFDGEKVELVTFQRKPSVVAEAFRSTLTSILFQDENGHCPQVLVFTSAQASEGKTTIVSNLAIAIAEIRRKVLVIDADLRRPRMHEIFGLTNTNGLSDLLLKELTEDDLDTGIKPTEIQYLDVITAGAAAHSSTNLFHSPNMLDLLEICKKRYDMILIDTPPALQITDARVVGRVADGVILVARANKTTRDVLLAVHDRFSHDRIGIMGAILNDWDPKKSRNGYYGYRAGTYYNGYKYGYSAYSKNGKA